MKKALIILMLLSAGFAADLSVVQKPNKATLEEGEGAEFNMSVTNTGTEELDLKLTLTGVPTWMRAFPNSLNLNPGNTKTIFYYFSNKASSGSYIYDIELKNSETQEILWDGNLVVKVGGDIEFDPPVTAPQELLVSTTSLAAPGDTLIVEVQISDNLIPSPIYLSLLKNNREVSSISDRLDAAVNELVLPVPATEEAGTYTVRAHLPGKALSNQTSVEIGRVSKVEITTNVEKQLLGKKITFVAENQGNVFKEDQLTTRISLFDRPLLEASPPPQISREGAGYVLTWDYRISPGDEKVLASYSIDYAPYSIIGVLFVIALILVLQKPEPVEVRKEIESIEGEHETVFKVNLHISNSSDEVVGDAVVTDLVPSIATVTQAYILKPKAKKTREGTELKWELGRLQPGEERLISYKAVLGFGIVGKLHLPKPEINWKR